MRAFSFPNQIDSFEELERDVLYHKIPEVDRSAICSRAWETGIKAAESVLDEFGIMPIKGILRATGVKIEHDTKDNVSGNIRFFSEYYSGLNKIVLYEKSIYMWAKENKFSQKESENLILSHEYYHYLECTKLGLTSKQYTVPTIKIGSLVLMKSGIKALSEIGAHGFSRRFYELTVGLPQEKDSDIN